MRKLLVGCVLLAGCAARPEATAPRAAPDSRPRLWAVVDTLAINRSAAMARYGPPVSVGGDTARNFNQPDVVDSIVSVRFPHFEAGYSVHPDRRVSLRHITISTPVATLPSQVRPGVSRDSLVAYL